MNATWLSVLLLSTLGLAWAQIDVCQPMDPGPFLGTLPPLYFNVDEATQQDLPGNCNTPSRYMSEVRLVGSMAEYSLTVEGIPSLDPSLYFTLMECGGRVYYVLTSEVDRDGFTSDLSDDVSYMSAKLKCQPVNDENGTMVYDARFFINDINDNMPVFPVDSSTTNVNISEATDVGTVITVVKADDIDENTNGITYDLMNQLDLFSVDSKTGEVTLMAPLDYEALGDEKRFDLVFLARDGGPGMTHTATSTVHVHITDFDDLGPAFVYPGCFKHSGVCAWPKYTAGLSVKKDTEIEVLPVPNKVKGPVTIEAYDRDLSIGYEIVFKIASTIPPGHEAEFTVVTTRTSGNRFIARVKPLFDMQLKEGFEIFLKAEEQSMDKKHEVAMIYFTNPPSSSSSSSSASSSSQDGTNIVPVDQEEEYTDREVGLIAAVSVLAALVFCMTIAILCVLRKRGSSKDNSDMGQTNGNIATHRL